MNGTAKAVPYPKALVSPVLVCVLPGERLRVQF